jgi:hypothetical protein
LRIRQVVGAILSAVGVVWVGQGVGLIGGSFMTGDALWAVIGAIALLFGITLLAGPRRDRRFPGADEDG